MRRVARLPHRTRSGIRSQHDHGGTVVAREVGMGSRCTRGRTRIAVRIAIFAIAFSLLTPRLAAAGDFWCWLFGGCGGGDRTAGQSSPQSEAPEIDPSALANALALAAGGAAVLGGRRRRRR
jgi:hypothetical protein